MQKSVRVPVETLYNFMIAVFDKLGVPAAESKICADVLIESDLRGIESHGTGRLKMYYDRIKEGIQFATTKIDVISDRKATAVWDGNHGMGHVIGVHAMETALDKAEKYGMGSVAVRNSTHYGIAGYYALMAAKRNMLGFSFTNARPSIAPTFGVEPMLGTNPICFGVPTDMEYPFIYDAATSISQRGKIEVLDRAEEETPTGWAIGEDGTPITDSKQLLDSLVKRTAAMLPLGGGTEILGSHKGFGLATMVEILCASLANGSYGKDLLGWEGEKRVPFKLGHFFMAINIDFFQDVEVFKKTTGDILRKIQNSKKDPEHEKIYVAGEKEYIIEKEIRAKGVLVNENLKKNIITMQEELALHEFKCPF